MIALGWCIWLGMMWITLSKSHDPLEFFIEVAVCISYVAMLLILGEKKR
jgi:hypothetical protein